MRLAGSARTRSVRAGGIEMLERRIFLTGLTATMATAMVPGGIVAATLGPPGKTSTSGSLRDQLAALVDRNFYLVDSGGLARSARLVAVDDGPQCPGLEQFSIVFEGSDLAEGLYETHSWHTGRLLISLLPSGKSRSGKNRQRAYFSNFV